MGWSANDRIGDFELVRKLGAGGMGEVWEARDTRLGRPVALKRLLPELAHAERAIARIEREARLQASLSSDHIARIYELERVGDDVFLAMELIEGRSVRELLREGPIEVDDALVLFAQLCLALQVAHRAGVVHRDLKPSNLIVRPDGSLVVLDFGIAWRPDEGADAALTRSGAIVGSVAYMSPQQATGERVGIEADIWAAGVTLFEMIAGEPPFRGASTAEVTAAILRDEAPSLREIVPEVDRRTARLVSKCLSKAPSERPSDAFELLDLMPAIPIPLSGSPRALLSPDLLAKGRAHPPLKTAARFALATAAVLGALVVAASSAWSWRTAGPWVERDHVEVQAEALAEALGLDEGLTHRASGFESSADGDVELWVRMSATPLYIRRYPPRFDLPQPTAGELRFAFDPSGALVGFDWFPGAATPSPRMRATLLAAVGRAPPSATGTPDGAVRGHALERHAGGLEIPGDAERVVHLRSRAPVESGRIRPQPDRGDLLGLGLLTITLLVFGWSLYKRRGDVRGSVIFGAVTSLLLLSYAVLVPRMLVDGGWADLIRGSALMFVWSALAYYGLEPIVRRRWPGMLVGWERLLRWRGRDPVLGREMLLGVAALLPYGLALWIERAVLGNTTVPLRGALVPLMGDPGAFAAGLPGVVAFELASVALGLLLASLAISVVRVRWIAIVIGFLPSALLTAGVEVRGGLVLMAVTLAVTSLLAYRGGLVALTVFNAVSALLSAVVSPSLGLWTVPYSVGAMLPVFAAIGYAVYLARERRVTESQSQPAARAAPSSEASEEDLATTAKEPAIDRAVVNEQTQTL